MQQVLLVPVALFRQHPGLGVFIRQKDVMEMHIHARLEPGQHLKKQKVDITAGFTDVRGVNEQHITAFKFIEKRQIDLLQPGRYQPGNALNPGDKKVARIRLNAGDVDAAIEHAPVGVGHDQ